MKKKKREKKVKIVKRKSVVVKCIYITPCTRKAIEAKQKRLSQDYKVFLAEKGAGKGANELFVKGRELQEIRSLMGTLTVRPPREQATKIKIGNSAKILVNGRIAEVFLDGVSGIKNGLPLGHAIISTGSKLGKVLLNKETGQSGTYEVENVMYSFVVKEIKPYSLAKKVFFKEQEQH